MIFVSAIWDLNWSLLRKEPFFLDISQNHTHNPLKMRRIFVHWQAWSRRRTRQLKVNGSQLCTQSFINQYTGKELVLEEAWVQMRQDWIVWKEREWVLILSWVYLSILRASSANRTARPGSMQGLLDVELMVFHLRASVLCRRRTREKRRTYRIFSISDTGPRINAGSWRGSCRYTPPPPKPVRLWFH